MVQMPVFRVGLPSRAVPLIVRMLGGGGDGSKKLGPCQRGGDLGGVTSSGNGPCSLRAFGEQVIQ